MLHQVGMIQKTKNVSGLKMIYFCFISMSRPGMILHHIRHLEALYLFVLPRVAPILMDRDGASAITSIFQQKDGEGG